MTQAIEILYRHLGLGGWSRLPGHISRNGYASKGKGPSHYQGGLTMTDIVLNNPKSIKSGCIRILKNLADPTTKAGKEVIAYCGGSVVEGCHPVGTFQGVMHLDRDRGVFVIADVETRIDDDGDEYIHYETIRDFPVNEPHEPLTGITIVFNEYAEVYA